MDGDGDVRNLIMSDSRNCAILCVVILLTAVPLLGGDYQRLAYNNPGLTVDLGVGLWA